jgi:hypothetical protein
LIEHKSKENDMSNAFISASVSTTQYLLRRLTIDVGLPVHEFRARYEAAVPQYPESEVKALVARRAPWQEMLDLVARVAPFGFLLYGTTVLDPVMHLAGDGGSCVAYLMGNHTIAERMFRFEPSVMIHAPLRTAIWSPADGAARFTLDKPSDHFGTFATPPSLRLASNWIARWRRCSNILASEFPTTC